MTTRALATIFLLACAGASAGTMTTGVRGIVHIAPAHGGPQRIGESGRAPLADANVLVLTADHRAVAHVVTGADGQFSAAIPPGEYQLKVDVGNAVLPRCAEARAIVQEGHVEQVELECDSGMR